LERNVSEHCRHTLQRAYFFIDGELLSAAERHEISVHLEECGPCFERYGLDKEVTEIVARLRRHSPCPQGLRIRITSLFTSS